jgi:hypothetical protein
VVVKRLVSIEDPGNIVVLFTVQREIGASAS